MCVLYSGFEAGHENVYGTMCFFLSVFLSIGLYDVHRTL